jgi:hypothetical protein
LISTPLPHYGEQKISKYIKLAKLAVVQVIGSIEDEQCFFTFNLMKTKLKNQLMEHLELVI